MDSFGSLQHFIQLSKNRLIHVQLKSDAITMNMTKRQGQRVETVKITVSSFTVVRNALKPLNVILRN